MVSAMNETTASARELRARCASWEIQYENYWKYSSSHDLHDLFFF